MAGSVRMLCLENSSILEISAMKPVLDLRHHEFRCKAHEWPKILEFYKEFGEDRMSPMTRFVSQVISSDYLHGLFAVTSHFNLWIAQTREFASFRNVLVVELIGDGFEFSYFDDPHRKPWVKQSDIDSSFGTFEHVINRLNWFVK